MKQHPTPLVILLQAQLKLSQVVNGIEYFVSATEVTLQNYQALQGMLFGIKKKWGGCCGELALPKPCMALSVCFQGQLLGIRKSWCAPCSQLQCAGAIFLHRCLEGPVWGTWSGQAEARSALLTQGIPSGFKNEQMWWGGAAVSWTCLVLSQSHAVGAAVLCCQGMLFSKIEKKYGCYYEPGLVGYDRLQCIHAVSA